MTVRWNIDPVHEANEMARLMCQQSANLTSEQVQTAIEFKAQLVMQTLALEAQRAEIASELDFIGQGAAKIIQNIVAEPGFFQ